MSLAEILPDLMTVDEFLRWPGDGSGRRAELVDGVIRMPESASDAHGTIQSNLHLLIGNHLRKTRPRCRIVIAPGIAPRLRTKWNYREPDLGVTCSANVKGVHMMPDPILLIEVLSPSNASDTWSNIPLYATVPTVSEILIVDSSAISAEVLRRLSDGSWPHEGEAIAPGGTIRLDSVGLEFPLAEAYAGTWLGVMPPTQ